MKIRRIFTRLVSDFDSILPFLPMYCEKHYSYSPIKSCPSFFQDESFTMLYGFSPLGGREYLEMHQIISGKLSMQE